MSFEAQDVKRKILSILKILQKSSQPVGSRIISQELANEGIKLSERAVRYHLKLMDERGLTELIRNQDGRIVTQKGLEEIKRALVRDKVGLRITKIETLAFKTDFDYKSLKGNIPVNISLFTKSSFPDALKAMRPAFAAGFCVSDFVVAAEPGESIGEIVVPKGKIALATVCSITTNGSLLKAGIPMDSKLCGILQLQNGTPVRFTEIIYYNGCSLDPSEIFIRAKMTSVGEAVRSGNGEVLANFREVPAICMPIVTEVLAGLKNAGFGGLLIKGNTSEPVCEVSVDQNKVGLILTGGLNPVAAAQEAGIDAENHCMSSMVEYGNLKKFNEIFKKYGE